MNTRDYAGGNEGKTYKLLPEGKYKMVVADFERKVAKTSGNPMLTVELNVYGGPHDGAKVWDNCVLIESSLWRLASLCHALGFSGDIDENDNKVLWALFSSGQLEAMIYHEEGNDGVVRPKVKFYIDHPDLNATPEDDGVPATVGGYNLADYGRPLDDPPPHTDADAPPADDDDIPL